MEANEFVKKFGWDGAKRVIGLTIGNSWADHYNIEDDSIGTAGTIYSKKLCEHNDNFVCLRSLKRLVESLELVEFVGGDLDGAKRFCEFAEDMKYLQKRGRLILVEDVRKAILDVESCNA